MSQIGIEKRDRRKVNDTNGYQEKSLLTKRKEEDEVGEEVRATGASTCHRLRFKTPARLLGRTFPRERTGQLRD